MAQDVARPSLADALTERMLELIRADGLRPGDRLPSARELSQRFAVTTPTLREALRRLEATGAVQLRHGSGIYVGADLERVVIPNPNVGELEADRLLQLLDARLLIEPPLAGRAARLAGPADVELLRAILDQAGADLRGGEPAGRNAAARPAPHGSHTHASDAEARLHKANMSFHSEVAGVAGNSVLCEVIDSLLTVHASEQREIQRIFDDRVRDFEEHSAILAAIEAGAEADAEALMRSHLTDIKHVIEQRLA
ncbi:GntR family transcriptional regulator, transcriptional repressor for pyruvate dehydrogenase complex [Actinomadura meyerae]|jgi:GntR family transcriptional repressor for pyruvate dehydrogenase complex|uniref:GntR family transcriptional regulator, transcriptional repressor for pyruvate dehydrogenase complex n=1 Tax=Actinomadura meyerae TaxID=240840 RepID=A0A239HUD7_9ACTN|nr:GntR family transcriptional regulator [Actinomadura meyerae]SNS85010.1 GntR family transcriptional regulator, transcriptional repressor for pyruvate dehydrogenase complex [Actinomadura meyerae]